jgi:hypothetical protein
VQHTVGTEPDARITRLDASDLQGIADVTLPIPNPPSLSYQLDSQRNVAVLSSSDGNLRVVGFAAQQVPRGTLMGFIVEIAASYLQIVDVAGRFVLRDGNNRAAALVKQGITQVPALVRRFGHGEDLAVLKGVLAPAMYLGERPPTPLDYWDPAVSIAISVQPRRKFVVIQGIEQSLVDAGG